MKIIWGNSLTQRFWRRAEIELTREPARAAPHLGEVFTSAMPPLGDVFFARWIVRNRPRLCEKYNFIIN